MPFRETYESQIQSKYVATWAVAITRNARYPRLLISEQPYTQAFPIPPTHEVHPIPVLPMKTYLKSRFVHLIGYISIYILTLYQTLKTALDNSTLQDLPLGVESISNIPVHISLVTRETSSIN